MIVAEWRAWHLSLRCCKLSRRFEDFWERRSAAAVAAA